MSRRSNLISTTVYLTKDQIKAQEYIKKKFGVPGAELIRRGLNIQIQQYDIPQYLKDKL